MSDNKIKSPADLLALRDKAKEDVELRAGGKALRITVHMGTCGIASGARDVLKQLAAELSAAGAKDVTLTQTGCAGLCDQEPMISLTDATGSMVRYGKLDAQKVGEIVRKHVLGGTPIVDYMIRA